MAAQANLFFDERFLERHAGSIILKTDVAIVELVANAWDAWATQVDIHWAMKGSDQTFSITDNGKGLTRAQFEKRWGTLDYDRRADEGFTISPPDELKDQGPRRPYGRNGKGRHAGFRFGDPYIVRTWRGGEEVTYRVRRGTTPPFVIEHLSTRQR